MRRTNWKTVSTLVTMLVVAGCSESVVSPTTGSSTASPSSTTSIQMAPQDRPSLSLSGVAPTNGVGSFTVDQNGGLFFVGSNAVYFPRNSICEPQGDDSNYTKQRWEASCTPLARSISVGYVTSVLPDGRTSVDFTTPLRFVPSDDPSNWVWIYMASPSASRTSDLSKLTIYYAPTPLSRPVDESVANPTLRTYVDRKSGTSIRRIQHFSGYTQYGVACDPATSLDPTCHESDDHGFTHGP